VTFFITGTQKRLNVFEMYFITIDSSIKCIYMFNDKQMSCEASGMFFCLNRLLPHYFRALDWLNKADKVQESGLVKM